MKISASEVGFDAWDATSRTFILSAEMGNAARLDRLSLVSTTVAVSHSFGVIPQASRGLWTIDHTPWTTDSDQRITSATR